MIVKEASYLSLERRCSCEGGSYPSPRPRGRLRSKNKNTRPRSARAPGRGHTVGLASRGGATGGSSEVSPRRHTATTRSERAPSQLWNNGNEAARCRATPPHGCVVTGWQKPCTSAARMRLLSSPLHPVERSHLHHDMVDDGAPKPPASTRRFSCAEIQPWPGRALPPSRLWRCRHPARRRP